jgi:UDP-N-acetylmuramoyl-tripeptide--D-alanyl-D-alanine ligase
MTNNQAAPLWYLSDIAAAVNGRIQGAAVYDTNIMGISIDTRTLEKGDAFIALVGPHHDGHDHIEQAFMNGAVVVVTHKEISNPLGPIIIVNDTLQALNDLGAAARARCSATIFAITGSVGKTSTKEMLAKALSVLGQTHAAEASLNNQWGVPLSLARMPVDTVYGVFELGMNHANEIKPLSILVSPNYSLITNISSAHIENLGSLENIARAKAEIFSGMDADGCVILPQDSEQFSILLAEARTQGIQEKNIITFGYKQNSTFQLIDVILEDQKTKLIFSFKGKEYSLISGLSGKHQATNILAVIAVVAQICSDIEVVFPAFEDMQPVKGRGNRLMFVIEKNQTPLLVIDETHNASPIAMRAAFDVLSQIPTTGRRLVALGDMLELGETAIAEHVALKDYLLSSNVDHVLTCGPLMAHLAQALPFGRNTHFMNSEEMAKALHEILKPADVLMVKGSRSSKMKMIIKAIEDLALQAETKQKITEIMVQ